MASAAGNLRNDEQHDDDDDNTTTGVMVQDSDDEADIKPVDAANAVTEHVNALPAVPTKKTIVRKKKVSSTDEE